MGRIPGAVIRFLVFLICCAAGPFLAGGSGSCCLPLSAAAAQAFETPPDGDLPLAELRDQIHASGAQWSAGETSLSALGAEERRWRFGARRPAPGTVAAAAPYPAPSGALPSRFDWRNRGGRNFVTPARDQGRCNSCWAFATTAGLESQVLIAKGGSVTTLDLSEQALLNCSEAGNCVAGGFMNGAADMMWAAGLPLESCSRYNAQTGTCSQVCSGWWERSHGLKGYEYHTDPPTVAALKNLIVTRGPVATFMVVYADFLSYRGGVYRHVAGSAVSLHNVLLIGYDDAARCFIAKNSWGPGWGEQGFFRIAYSELNSDVSLGQDTISYLGAVGPTEPTPNRALDGFRLLTSWSREDWLAQGADTFDGKDALAGRPSGSSTASLSTSVRGPARVSFQWRNNAATAYETFKYRVSSAAGTVREDELIGPTGWEAEAFRLASGSYRISWECESSDPCLLDKLAIDPPVVVLAPNGGQSLVSGTVQKVRWKAWPEAAVFALDLYCTDTARWTAVAAGVKGTSYSWTVPRTAVTRTDCQVRVTARSGSGRVLGSDRSDRTFRILPP